MTLDTARCRFKSTNMVGGNHWGGKENAFGRSLGCAVETIFVEEVVCRDEKNSEREKSIFRFDDDNGRIISATDDKIHKQADHKLKYKLCLKRNIKTRNLLCRFSQQFNKDSTLLGYSTLCNDKGLEGIRRPTAFQPP